MTNTTQLGYADLVALMRRLSGDEKHNAAAESTVDVLWVLYDEILNIGPDNLRRPDRDRFLLSKGHGPMAFYAVLAAKGLLDTGELDRWGEFDSALGGHPDGTLIPAAEIASGSLGHGLPLGLGIVLGWRAQQRRTPRAVVLVGDAELDEGSNHEAIEVAGRLGLDQLTVVVVDNSSASYGWPGGIARRFTEEGWAAAPVNGRDHAALRKAFSKNHLGRPLVVVATVEPKGV